MAAAPSADVVAGWLAAWPAVPDSRTAVEALIGSGALDDPDLIASCVVPIGGTPPAAVVDWAALGDYAAHLTANDAVRGQELEANYQLAARGWRTNRARLVGPDSHRQ